VTPPPDAALPPEPDAPPPPECTTSSQCGGSTPYCVANRCEECNGDAACTASEPVCSGADHTCGGCAIDADCALYPATPNCGTAGACVECANDGDCGGGTPYCVANRCEQCDGASTCTATEPVCSTVDYTCGGCAADTDCSLYAATPNCAPSGACVECVDNADCSGTSPICDTQSCRACAAGSECGSGECHLDTGACFAGTELIYLSPTGDDANACTKSAKCKTLTRALALVTATKHTITLAAGTYAAPSTAITTTVDVLGHGATIQGAIAAAGTASVAVYDATIDSAFSNITIDSSASLRLERVTASTGMIVSGTITLIDVHSSFYIYSYKMATLRRVTFMGATAGSTFMGGWDIANSTFVRNTGGVTLSSPVAGSPQRFENNTVANNGSIFSQNQILDLKCVSGAGGVIRNNIVWSSFTPGSGSTVTSGCPQTYSLVYTGTASAYPGTGNLLGDPAFVRISPSGSLPADFHLTASSVARDTADPSSPLADDMDGDSRPANGRADIGADEYLP
jgi:hypothetical protein